MILLINNKIDSQIYSLIGELRKALEVEKIPYFEINNIQQNIKDFNKIKHKIKGIIFSGSDMKLTSEIMFESVVKDIFPIVELDVPVLGLCFGCQLLSLIYGGKLIKGKGYQCGFVKTKLSKNLLFDKIENEQVFDQQFFCFTDMPIINKNGSVKEIAWSTRDGKKYACGFEFKKNKYWGLMFHPEFAASRYVVFKNFAKICGVI